MATITSHGLALEQSVLARLILAHIERFRKRGVTETTIAESQTVKDNRETKRSLASGERSGSKELTKKEASARDSLHSNCRKLQHAAHNVFPARSPQLKEFHVGDNIDQNTSIALGHARDIAAAGEKYKDRLITEGKLIQQDFDDLAASITAFDDTNAAQEVARTKDSPEATASHNEAMAALQKLLDSFHSTASVEFITEPEILKQFDQAKKLRFTPEPRPPKQSPEPPAQ